MLECVRQAYNNASKNLGLHQQPATLELEYTGQGSRIYSTYVNDFEQLSADAMQKIYRHRHILLSSRETAPSINSFK